MKSLFTPAPVVKELPITKAQSITQVGDKFEVVLNRGWAFVPGIHERRFDSEMHARHAAILAVMCFCPECEGYDPALAEMELERRGS